MEIKNVVTVTKGDFKVRRAKYTDEFEGEVVRQLEQRGNRTGDEVAKSLGVRTALLYKWRRRYSETVVEARKERDGTEAEELKRLCLEVVYLRRQQEIPKNATAFFAKECDK